MTIQQLLDIVVEKNASDLHLAVGFPPLIRVNSIMYPVQGTSPITPAEIDALINPLITDVQKNIYQQTWELDFSFEYQNKGRFRANIYRQKGFPAIALRLIPFNIRTIEELGFPQSVRKIPELKQGFVLVTGPTGHGKSTTLAAFINQINQTRPVHIVTIEDPIEYVYPAGKALISQREMYSDTKSWDNSLRSVLREDPDVVLIGEMRDLSTITAAMTIAETGHLVFATLHTNSAAQSIDRIVDVFPENQQAQIKLQLASTLEGILSLRLLPTIEPGRVLAYEILFATAAARNIIREGKTYLIDNLIQTSAELGMVSMESSLASLVKAGKITSDEAVKYTLHPETLMKLLS